MNKEEVQKVIKQIRNNQERYNRKLKVIVQKLKRARIDTKPTGMSAIDKKQIVIGDQVRIINPSRFGGKEGTVVKLTQTRVTVATTRGKVVRAHKNVQKIK